MTQNLRRCAFFAPHTILEGDVIGLPLEAPVNNLVLKGLGEANAWIEEATSQIGEWRSLAQSVYIRWAITINACELAEKHYGDKPDTGLYTKALRLNKGHPEHVKLALWPGPEAAGHYATTQGLISAYAVSDLSERLRIFFSNLWKSFTAITLNRSGFSGGIFV
jgi:hypothetical protein